MTFSERSIIHGFKFDGNAIAMPSYEVCLKVGWVFVKGFDFSVLN